ncbi:hypothetical protein BVIRIDIS_15650 [Blastochloris viridis]|uniref:Uncharacterized protein n=1 Tax=Blastochloris viridis TaxID=1079 RepID=A0A0S4Q1Z4_BLAVI|nr:hypothetical protein BVIRIDIS_15650 [Blastochloris viridis]
MRTLHREHRALGAIRSRPADIGQRELSFSAQPLEFRTGPSGRMQEKPPAERAGLASAPPGHPAQGRYDVAAGLLARGSQPSSGLPRVRYPSDSTWTSARRSQLRGQPRICRFLPEIRRAGFPLSSGPSGSQNHDAGNVPPAASPSQPSCSRNGHYHVGARLGHPPIRQSRVGAVSSYAAEIIDRKIGSPLRKVL